MGVQGIHPRFNRIERKYPSEPFLEGTPISGEEDSAFAPSSGKVNDEDPYPHMFSEIQAQL